MVQQMPGKKILSSRTFVSSPLSNMSPIGIATVVLPNRKTDNKAGGSGAAGHWQWPANSMVQQMQGNMCLVISSFVKSYPVLLNHIQFFISSCQRVLFQRCAAAVFEVEQQQIWQLAVLGTQ
jgi:hypothetical protein